MTTRGADSLTSSRRDRGNGEIDLQHAIISNYRRTVPFSFTVNRIKSSSDFGQHPNQDRMIMHIINHNIVLNFLVVNFICEDMFSDGKAITSGPLFSPGLCRDSQIGIGMWNTSSARS